MKQRIVSAAFGIVVILVILFFYQTLIFNFAIVLINLLAIYEIVTATHNRENWEIVAACTIFAAAAPFFDCINLEKSGAFICVAFLIMIFAILLCKHRTVSLSQASVMFMLTLLVSVSLSCLVYLRDIFERRGRYPLEALFYIAFVFIAAWVTDAGGYFIGTLFGKHKLSPLISPKKTIEGAVGGVTVTMLALMGLGAGYASYLDYIGHVIYICWVPFLVLALLCALISILGDLSASLIKRENGIKDFGNILPGHGGILDRFDSILFVAPLVLWFVQIFPIVR